MKNIKELELDYIELEDQVLLVDISKDLRNVNDSKIWNYCPNSGMLFRGYQSHLDDRALEGKIKYPHPVLTSTKQLEGLPLLVIEDIESTIKGNNHYKINDTTSQIALGGYIREYNEARETYRYTEEDLWQAVELSKRGKDFYVIKNFLNQKQLWIEAEIDYFEITKTHEGIFEPINEVYIPKIRNNKIKAVWK